MWEATRQSCSIGSVDLTCSAKIRCLCRGCGRGVGASAQVGRHRTCEGCSGGSGREGHVDRLDPQGVSRQKRASAAGAQDRQPQPLAD